MLRISSRRLWALLLLSVLFTTATHVSAQSTDASSPTSINFILPTPAPGTPQNPGNRTLSQCPGPLIANTQNLDISTCLGGCCIKCPAFEYFYEPNKISTILHAAYVTRQVSLGAAVFMVISYLLLPGKRSQPHISVLFLTVSLSLWFAAFDVMPGVNNACANEFEQSTGHNSKLCGIQGVLIIYFTQTCALWCSLLIYKLHLLAVWRADFIDRYYAWFTAFCWIFPLAFAIPVAVMNLAEYPGVGFSCLVSNEHLNTYLFYPTAVYIYPAILAHLITVAKMIHLAILSSKIDTGLSQLSNNARIRANTTMQARRLLRGQWRPALMLGTTMLAFTIFWLFYFVDAHRLAELSPTTPWLRDWIGCIYASSSKGLTSDETQTLCAGRARPNMPSIVWFASAELILAVIGIVVAVIFVSKAEFWNDWAFVLHNLAHHGRLGDGSPAGRRQSGGVTTPGVVSPTGPNPYDHDMQGQGRSHKAGSEPYHDPELGCVMVEPNRMTKEANPGTQWYDMDDLLDKEYDIQEGANRTDQPPLGGDAKSEMGAESGYNPSWDPPLYPANCHSGDILYSTPSIQEMSPPLPWSSSSPTMTSSKSYLIANDNSERYVEQPVVPPPVPRSSVKSKLNSDRSPQPFQEQRPFYLSSPSQSPGVVAATSLSPMPPKPAYVPNMLSTSPSRQVPPPSPPSEPKSPTQSPFSSVALPTPISSPETQSSLLNSSDSAGKVMVASRASISHGKGQGKIVAFDAVSRNNSVRKSPPVLPLKSPARQYPSSLHSPLQSPTHAPSSP